MATKREQEQQRRDLAAGQRAFDAQLSPEEQAAIIDGLHAGENERKADEALYSWTWRLQQLADEREKALEVVAQWSARLAERSARAASELEWADALFEAAAVIEVNAEALTILRAGGPDKAAAYLTSRLYAHAGPAHSTSNSSNMVQACRARAYTRVLEGLGWL